MSIENELQEIATQTAARVEKRATQLHQEYLDAQAFAAQKKTEFEFAKSATDRAFNFQFKIGSDYQCPVCLVESGVASNLRPARLSNGQGVCVASMDMIYL